MKRAIGGITVLTLVVGLAVLRAHGPTRAEKLDMDVDPRSSEIIKKAILEDLAKLTAANSSNILIIEDDISRDFTRLLDGLDFESAEQILQKAGFQIGARPAAAKAHDPNRATDWYGVFSSLPLQNGPPLGRSVAYVTLLPAEPFGYSKIAKVKAEILRSSL